MAQQATVKRAPETPVLKHAGGRPAGSRNKVKAKVFDFSRFKLSFTKSAEFYAYLEQYPEKSGLLISVYRLRPRIDHSLIGIDQSAILQTSDPAAITEDVIGETYGRGAYMLKLNDANRPRGQQECCRTWLELWDVEKPPQYDPRTLCLGEAKNQDEITRLLNAGVLVRDAHGAPRIRGENDPLPAPPAAAPVNGHQNGYSGGGDLFGRDVVGQIVLAALDRTNQSPRDAVKDTIEVARMLAPPAINEDSIVDKLHARLAGANGRTPGPVDDFAAYERVEGFMNKIRGTVGTVIDGANGAPSAFANPATWMPHVAPAIAQTRALLSEVFGFFSRPNKAQENGGDARQLGAQQTMRAPQTMEELIEEVAMMGLQRMEEHVTGFDFAAYVCGFHRPPHGRECYEFLEQAGGTTGVLALMSLNPVSRPLISDPAQRKRLEEFLDSFFTFDTSGLPGGAQSSEPPAASGVAA